MSTEDKPENTTPAEQPQVSSAAEFEKSRQARETGEVITLPSGLSVLVRKPSVRKMMTTGQIPSDVASAIQSADAQAAAAGGKISTKLSTQELAKVVEFSTIVARTALVNPKVVADGATPDYANGEIAFDDLDDADVRAIVEYVQGGADENAKFRSQQSGIPA